MSEGKKDEEKALEMMEMSTASSGVVALSPPHTAEASATVRLSPEDSVPSSSRFIAAVTSAAQRKEQYGRRNAAAEDDDDVFPEVVAPLRIAGTPPTSELLSPNESSHLPVDAPHSTSPLVSRDQTTLHTTTERLLLKTELTAVTREDRTPQPSPEDETPGGLQSVSFISDTRKERIRSVPHLSVEQIMDSGELAHPGHLPMGTPLQRPSTHTTAEATGGDGATGSSQTGPLVPSLEDVTITFSASPFTTARGGRVEAEAELLRSPPTGVAETVIHNTLPLLTEQHTVTATGSSPGSSVLHRTDAVEESVLLQTPSKDETTATNDGETENGEAAIGAPASDPVEMVLPSTASNSETMLDMRLSSASNELRRTSFEDQRRSSPVTDFSMRTESPSCPAALRLPPASLVPALEDSPSVEMKPQPQLFIVTSPVAAASKAEAEALKSMSEEEGEEVDDETEDLEDEESDACFTPTTTATDGTTFLPRHMQRDSVLESESESGGGLGLSHNNSNSNSGVVRASAGGRVPRRSSSEKDVFTAAAAAAHYATLLANSTANTTFSTTSSTTLNGTWNSQTAARAAAAEPNDSSFADQGTPLHRRMEDQVEEPARQSSEPEVTASPLVPPPPPRRTGDVAPSTTATGSSARSPPSPTEFAITAAAPPPPQTSAEEVKDLIEREEGASALGSSVPQVGEETVKVSIPPLRSPEADALDEEGPEASTPAAPLDVANTPQFGSASPLAEEGGSLHQPIPEHVFVAMMIPTPPPPPPQNDFSAANSASSSHSSLLLATHTSVPVGHSDAGVSTSPSKGARDTTSGADRESVESEDLSAPRGRCTEGDNSGVRTHHRHQGHSDHSEEEASWREKASRTNPSVADGQKWESRTMSSASSVQTTASASTTNRMEAAASERTGASSHSPPALSTTTLFTRAPVPAFTATVEVPPHRSLSRRHAFPSTATLPASTSAAVTSVGRTPTPEQRQLPSASPPHAPATEDLGFHPASETKLHSGAFPTTRRAQSTPGAVTTSHPQHLLQNSLSASLVPSASPFAMAPFAMLREDRVHQRSNKPTSTPMRRGGVPFSQTASTASTTDSSVSSSSPGARHYFPPSLRHHPVERSSPKAYPPPRPLVAGATTTTLPDDSISDERGSSTSYEDYRSSYSGSSYGSSVASRTVLRRSRSDRSRSRSRLKGERGKTGRHTSNHEDTGASHSLSRSTSNASRHHRSHRSRTRERDAPHQRQSSSGRKEDKKQRSRLRKSSKRANGKSLPLGTPLSPSFRSRSVSLTISLPPERSRELEYSETLAGTYSVVQPGTPLPPRRQPPRQDSDRAFARTESSLAGTREKLRALEEAQPSMTLGSTSRKGLRHASSEYPGYTTTTTFETTTLGKQGEPHRRSTTVSRSTGSRYSDDDDDYYYSYEDSYSYDSYDYYSYDSSVASSPRLPQEVCTETPPAPPSSDPPSLQESTTTQVDMTVPLMAWNMRDLIQQEEFKYPSTSPPIHLAPLADVPLPDATANNRTAGAASGLTVTDGQSPAQKSLMDTGAAPQDPEKTEKFIQRVRGEGEVGDAFEECVGGHHNGTGSPVPVSAARSGSGIGSQPDTAEGTLTGVEGEEELRSPPLLASTEKTDADPKEDKPTQPPDSAPQQTQGEEPLTVPDKPDRTAGNDMTADNTFASPAAPNAPEPTLTIKTEVMDDETASPLPVEVSPQATPAVKSESHSEQSSDAPLEVSSKQDSEEEAVLQASTSNIGAFHEREGDPASPVLPSSPSGDLSLMSSAPSPAVRAGATPLETREVGTSVTSLLQEEKAQRKKRRREQKAANEERQRDAAAAAAAAKMKAEEEIPKTPTPLAPPTPLPPALYAMEAEPPQERNRCFPKGAGALPVQQSLEALHAPFHYTRWSVFVQVRELQSVLAALRGDPPSLEPSLQATLTGCGIKGFPLVPTWVESGSILVRLALYQPTKNDSASGSAFDHFVVAGEKGKRYQRVAVGSAFSLSVQKAWSDILVMAVHDVPSSTAPGSMVGRDDYSTREEVQQRGIAKAAQSLMLILERYTATSPHEPPAPPHSSAFPHTEEKEDESVPPSPAQTFEKRMVKRVKMVPVKHKKLVTVTQTVLMPKVEKRKVKKEVLSKKILNANAQECGAVDSPHQEMDGTVPQKIDPIEASDAVEKESDYTSVFSSYHSETESRSSSATSCRLEPPQPAPEGASTSAVPAQEEMTVMEVEEEFTVMVPTEVEEEHEIEVEELEAVEVEEEVEVEVPTSRGSNVVGLSLDTPVASTTWSAPVEAETGMTTAAVMSTGQTVPVWVPLLQSVGPLYAVSDHEQVLLPPPHAYPTTPSAEQEGKSYGSQGLRWWTGEWECFPSSYSRAADQEEDGRHPSDTAAGPATAVIASCSYTPLTALSSHVVYAESGDAAAVGCRDRRTRKDRQQLLQPTLPSSRLVKAIDHVIRWNEGRSPYKHMDEEMLEAFAPGGSKGTLKGPTDSSELSDEWETERYDASLSCDCMSSTLRKKCRHGGEYSRPLIQKEEEAEHAAEVGSAARHDQQKDEAVQHSKGFHRCPRVRERETSGDEGFQRGKPLTILWGTGLSETPREKKHSKRSSSLPRLGGATLLCSVNLLCSVAVLDCLPPARHPRRCEPFPYTRLTVSGGPEGLLGCTENTIAASLRVRDAWVAEQMKTVAGDRAPIPERALHLLPPRTYAQQAPLPRFDYRVQTTLALHETFEETNNAGEWSATATSERSLLLSILNAAAPEKLLAQTVFDPFIACSALTFDGAGGQGHRRPPKPGQVHVRAQWLPLYGRSAAVLVPGTTRSRVQVGWLHVAYSCCFLAPHPVLERRWDLNGPSAIGTTPHGRSHATRLLDAISSARLSTSAPPVESSHAALGLTHAARPLQSSAIVWKRENALHESTRSGLGLLSRHAFFPLMSSSAAAERRWFTPEPVAWLDLRLVGATGLSLHQPGRQGCTEFFTYCTMEVLYALDKGGYPVQSTASPEGGTTDGEEEEDEKALHQQSEWATTRIARSRMDRSAGEVRWFHTFRLNISRVSGIMLRVYRRGGETTPTHKEQGTPELASPAALLGHVFLSRPMLVAMYRDSTMHLGDRRLRSGCFRLLPGRVPKAPKTEHILTPGEVFRSSTTTSITPEVFYGALQLEWARTPPAWLEDHSGPAPWSADPPRDPALDGQCVLFRAPVSVFRTPPPPLRELSTGYVRPSQLRVIWPWLSHWLGLHRRPAVQQPTPLHFNRLLRTGSFAHDCESAAGLLVLRLRWPGVETPLLWELTEVFLDEPELLEEPSKVEEAFQQARLRGPRKALSVPPPSSSSGPSGVFRCRAAEYFTLPPIPSDASRGAEWAVCWLEPQCPSGCGAPPAAGLLLLDPAEQRVAQSILQRRRWGAAEGDEVGRNSVRDWITPSTSSSMLIAALELGKGIFQWETTGYAEERAAASAQRAYTAALRRDTQRKVMPHLRPTATGRGSPSSSGSSGREELVHSDGDGDQAAGAVPRVWQAILRLQPATLSWNPSALLKDNGPSSLPDQKVAVPAGLWFDDMGDRPTSDLPHSIEPGYLRLTLEAVPFYGPARAQSAFRAAKATMHNPPCCGGRLTPALVGHHLHHPTRTPSSPYQYSTFLSNAAVGGAWGSTSAWQWPRATLPQPCRASLPWCQRPHLKRSDEESGREPTPLAREVLAVGVLEIGVVECTLLPSYAEHCLPHGGLLGLSVMEVQEEREACCGLQRQRPGREEASCEATNRSAPLQEEVQAWIGYLEKTGQLLEVPPHSGSSPSPAREGRQRKEAGRSGRLSNSNPSLGDASERLRSPLFHLQWWPLWESVPEAFCLGGCSTASSETCRPTAPALWLHFTGLGSRFRPSAASHDADVEIEEEALLLASGRIPRGLELFPEEAGTVWLPLFRPLISVLSGRSTTTGRTSGASQLLSHVPVGFVRVFYRHNFTLHHASPPPCPSSTTVKRTSTLATKPTSSEPKRARKADAAPLTGVLVVYVESVYHRPVQHCPPAHRFWGMAKGSSGGSGVDDSVMTTAAPPVCQDRAAALPSHCKALAPNAVPALSLESEEGFSVVSSSSAPHPNKSDSTTNVFLGWEGESHSVSLASRPEEKQDEECPAWQQHRSGWTSRANSFSASLISDETTQQEALERCVDLLESPHAHPVAESHACGIRREERCGGPRCTGQLGRTPQSVFFPVHANTGTLHPSSQQWQFEPLRIQVLHGSDNSSTQALPTALVPLPTSRMVERDDDDGCRNHSCDQPNTIGPDNARDRAENTALRRNRAAAKRPVAWRCVGVPLYALRGEAQLVCGAVTLHCLWLPHRCTADHETSGAPLLVRTGRKTSPWNMVRHSSSVLAQLQAWHAAEERRTATGLSEVSRSSAGHGDTTPDDEDVLIEAEELLMRRLAYPLHTLLPARQYVYDPLQQPIQEGGSEWKRTLSEDEKPEDQPRVLSPSCSGAHCPPSLTPGVSLQACTAEIPVLPSVTAQWREMQLWWEVLAMVWASAESRDGVGLPDSPSSREDAKNTTEIHVQEHTPYEPPSYLLLSDAEWVADLPVAEAKSLFPKADKRHDICVAIRCVPIVETTTTEVPNPFKPSPAHHVLVDQTPWESLQRRSILLPQTSMSNAETHSLSHSKALSPEKCYSEGIRCMAQWKRTLAPTAPDCEEECSETLKPSLQWTTTRGPVMGFPLLNEYGTSYGSTSASRAFVSTHAAELVGGAVLPSSDTSLTPTEMEMRPTPREAPPQRYRVEATLYLKTLPAEGTTEECRHTKQRVKPLPAAATSLSTKTTKERRYARTSSEGSSPFSASTALTGCPCIASGSVEISVGWNAPLAPVPLGRRSCGEAEAATPSGDALLPERFSIPLQLREGLLLDAKEDDTTAIRRRMRLGHAAFTPQKRTLLGHITLLKSFWRPLQGRSVPHTVSGVSCCVPPRLFRALPFSDDDRETETVRAPQTWDTDDDLLSEEEELHHFGDVLDKTLGERHVMGGSNAMWRRRRCRAGGQSSPHSTEEQQQTEDLAPELYLIAVEVIHVQPTEELITLWKRQVHAYASVWETRDEEGDDSPCVELPITVSSKGSEDTTCEEHFLTPSRPGAIRRSAGSFDGNSFSAEVEEQHWSDGRREAGAVSSHGVLHGLDNFAEGESVRSSSVWSNSTVSVPPPAEQESTAPSTITSWRWSGEQLLGEAESLLIELRSSAPQTLTGDTDTEATALEFVVVHALGSISLPQNHAIAARQPAIRFLPAETTAVLRDIATGRVLGTALVRTRLLCSSQHSLPPLQIFFHPVATVIFSTPVGMLHGDVSTLTTLFERFQRARRELEVHEDAAVVQVEQLEMLEEVHLLQHDKLERERRQKQGLFVSPSAGVAVKETGEEKAQGGAVLPEKMSEEPLFRPLVEAKSIRELTLAYKNAWKAHRQCFQQREERMEALGEEMIRAGKQLLMEVERASCTSPVLGLSARVSEGLLPPHCKIPLHLSSPFFSSVEFQAPSAVELWLKHHTAALFQWNQRTTGAVPSVTLLDADAQRGSLQVRSEPVLSLCVAPWVSTLTGAGSGWLEDRDVLEITELDELLSRPNAPHSGASASSTLTLHLQLEVLEMRDKRHPEKCSTATTHGSVVIGEGQLPLKCPRWGGARRHLWPSPNTVSLLLPSSMPRRSTAERIPETSPLCLERSGTGEETTSASTCRESAGVTVPAMKHWEWKVRRGTHFVSILRVQCDTPAAVGERSAPFRSVGVKTSATPDAPAFPCFTTTRLFFRFVYFLPATGEEVHVDVPPSPASPGASADAPASSWWSLATTVLPFIGPFGARLRQIAVGELLPSSTQTWPSASSVQRRKGSAGIPFTRLVGTCSWTPGMQQELFATRPHRRQTAGRMMRLRFCDELGATVCTAVLYAAPLPPPPCRLLSATSRGRGASAAPAATPSSGEWHSTLLLAGGAVEPAWPSAEEGGRCAGTTPIVKAHVKVQIYMVNIHVQLDELEETPYDVAAVPHPPTLLLSIRESTKARSCMKKKVLVRDRMAYSSRTSTLVSQWVLDSKWRERHCQPLGVESTPTRSEAPPLCVWSEPLLSHLCWTHTTSSEAARPSQLEILVASAPELANAEPDNNNNEEEEFFATTIDLQALLDTAIPLSGATRGSNSTSPEREPYCRSGRLCQSSLPLYWSPNRATAEDSQTSSPTARVAVGQLSLQWSLSLTQEEKGSKREAVDKKAQYSTVRNAAANPTESALRAPCLLSALSASQRQSLLALLGLSAPTTSPYRTIQDVCRQWQTRLVNRRQERHARLPTAAVAERQRMERLAAAAALLPVWSIEKMEVEGVQVYRADAAEKRPSRLLPKRRVKRTDAWSERSSALPFCWRSDSVGTSAAPSAAVESDVSSPVPVLVQLSVPLHASAGLSGEECGTDAPEEVHSSSEKAKVRMKKPTLLGVARCELTPSTVPFLAMSHHQDPAEDTRTLPPRFHGVLEPLSWPIEEPIVQPSVSRSGAQLSLWQILQEPPDVSSRAARAAAAALGRSPLQPSRTALLGTVPLDPLAGDLRVLYQYAREEQQLDQLRRRQQQPTGQDESGGVNLLCSTGNLSKQVQCSSLPDQYTTAWLPLRACQTTALCGPSQHAARVRLHLHRRFSSVATTKEEAKPLEPPESLFTAKQERQTCDLVESTVGRVGVCIHLEAVERWSSDSDESTASSLDLLEVLVLRLAVLESDRASRVVLRRNGPENSESVTKPLSTPSSGPAGEDAEAEQRVQRDNSHQDSRTGALKKRCTWAAVDASTEWISYNMWPQPEVSTTNSNGSTYCTGMIPPCALGALSVTLLTSSAGARPTSPLQKSLGQSKPKPMTEEQVLGMTTLQLPAACAPPPPPVPRPTAIGALEDSESPCLFPSCLPTILEVPLHSFADEVEPGAAIPPSKDVWVCRFALFTTYDQEAADFMREVQNIKERQRQKEAKHIKRWMECREESLRALPPPQVLFPASPPTPSHVTLCPHPVYPISNAAALPLGAVVLPVRFPGNQRPHLCGYVLGGVQEAVYGGSPDATSLPRAASILCPAEGAFGTTSQPLRWESPCLPDTGRSLLIPVAAAPPYHLVRHAAAAPSPFPSVPSRFLIALAGRTGHRLLCCSDSQHRRVVLVATGGASRLRCDGGHSSLLLPGRGLLCELLPQGMEEERVEFLYHHATSSVAARARGTEAQSSVNSSVSGHPLPTEVSHLYHSAVFDGERVWMLGGWEVPVGVALECENDSSAAPHSSVRAAGPCSARRRPASAAMAAGFQKMATECAPHHSPYSSHSRSGSRSARSGRHSRRCSCPNSREKKNLPTEKEDGIEALIAILEDGTHTERQPSNDFDVREAVSSSRNGMLGTVASFARQVYGVWQARRCNSDRDSSSSAPPAGRAATRMQRVPVSSALRWATSVRSIRIVPPGGGTSLTPPICRPLVVDTTPCTSAAIGTHAAASSLSPYFCRCVTAPCLSCHTTVQVGPYLITFGGLLADVRLPSQVTVSDELFCFDTRDGQWSRYDGPRTQEDDPSFSWPKARYGHSMIRISQGGPNIFLMAGGATATSSSPSLVPREDMLWVLELPTSLLDSISAGERGGCTVEVSVSLAVGLKWRRLEVPSPVLLTPRFQPVVEVLCYDTVFRDTTIGHEDVGTGQPPAKTLPLHRLLLLIGGGFESYCPLPSRSTATTSLLVHALEYFVFCWGTERSGKVPSTTFVEAELS